MQNYNKLIKPSEHSFRQKKPEYQIYSLSKSSVHFNNWLKKISSEKNESEFHYKLSQALI
jgi:hypothetical protein